MTSINQDEVQTQMTDLYGDEQQSQKNLEYRTEEEIKKEDDDYFKLLFKSKEINFKKNDPFGDNSSNNKFSADSLRDAFELKYKDRDGRILLHRAALEQNPDNLRVSFDTLDKQEEDKIKRIIDQQDNYGNTALLLSTIYDNEKKRENRFEVVNMLLSRKANPNVQNKTSLFTPLHWACVNGATDIVKLLLQYDAKEFIPDKYGLFPIDYAGQFKHANTVYFLIKHTLRKMKIVKQQHINLQQWENLLSQSIDYTGKNGKFSNFHDNPVLQFNPVFHTSVLYWASMFDRITLKDVQKILLRLEAYPEGAIIMEKWRTPCHAAAQVGNFEKLKLLLTDISTRYQKGLKPGETRKYDKDNICLYFKTRWQTLIKQKRYRRLATFYNEVFESKLTEYRNLVKFKYDFQDKFLNTPLHISSQYGNEKCTQMLLEDYELSLDIRNSQGWMPKDLLQHEVIKKVYLRFYHKLDQRYNEEFLTRQQTITAQDDESFANKRAADSQQPLQLNQTPSQIQIEEEKKKESQLTEKQKVNKELIRCREFMPQVPDMVLKVNTENTQDINKMIMRLQTQDFIIKIFPALVQNVYYITLSLQQSKLEQEAKAMKLKIKLCDLDCKIEFDPEQKQKFEPFRSKDIQKIIMTLIKKIINTDQLIEQKILLQIIPMHDLSGIHEIKYKWENKSRFFMQPIPLISQFYKEGIKFEFSELSAIKNYFGEKTGFYFAWMSFYTAWLIIPALLGLLVCIWVTIFIERWKRKSAEIAIRWGILDNNKDIEREVRPEFSGDEYFSNINYAVNKLNIHARFYFFIILSVPIFVILIGACIGVYFATREYKNNNLNGDINHDRVVQISAGVINGIVISIVNFLYQQLAILFMKLENHKYADTYEKSFIFKLFAFKFINTNISLFYTGFIDQNFSSLYYLIVGMTLQKAVQIIILKVGKRLAFFWFFRRLYFKKIHALGLEQQKLHDNFIRELDERSQQRLNVKIDELKNKAIFSRMFKEKQVVYQRLVFNTEQTIEESQMFVDYVELNSLMPERPEKDEIIEISDTFILFGLATLYACACPIVTFIVMIYNIFDIKLDLLIQYVCIRRPIVQVRSNIGPWLAIAEFMAIAAVISNSLLLYFSSPTLREWLSDMLQIQSEIYLLWIIVGIEHFIILVKVICSVSIPDVPGWVQKTLARVLHEKELMVIEQNERDEKELINAMKEKQRTFESLNNSILNSLKDKVKQITDELAQKDKMLREYAKQGNLKDKEINAKIKELEEKSKTALLMEQIEKEENQRKKAEDLKLVDFLGIKESEWYGKQRSVELEKALSRNLQRRLMNQTFNNIEREVLTRRIARLYDTKKINQVNCAQCSNKVSTIECADCQDHFCKECSDEIHNPKKQVFAMHNLVTFSLEPSQKFSLFKVPSDISQQLQLQQQRLQPLWKKFEYYNFPSDPGNDQYQFIQRHYAYLRQQYIDGNFIEPYDKINYQGLFVANQYDLLTETQAMTLKAKHKKVFGNETLGPQNDKFNDEELFYLNRIAYYLFRHKGDSLTFANFTMRLKILQSAPFQKRFTLWLSLMDEKGEENIERSTIEQIFRVVYMQDMNGIMKVEDVIQMLYGQGVKTMTINKIIEKVCQEKIDEEFKRVREFMECIVQFNPKEVKDT